MSNWRPDKKEWEVMLLAEVKKIPDPELLKGNLTEGLLLFAEAGADAMLKAKAKTHHSLEEIRVKLVDIQFEYMSVPEFVAWVYGEE